MKTCHCIWNICRPCYSFLPWVSVTEAFGFTLNIDSCWQRRVVSVFIRSMKRAQKSILVACHHALSEKTEYCRFKYFHFCSWLKLFVQRLYWRLWGNVREAKMDFKWKTQAILVNKTELRTNHNSIIFFVFLGKRKHRRKLVSLGKKKEVTRTHNTPINFHLISNIKILCKSTMYSAMQQQSD